MICSPLYLFTNLFIIFTQCFFKKFKTTSESFGLARILTSKNPNTVLKIMDELLWLILQIIYSIISVHDRHRIHKETVLVTLVDDLLRYWDWRRAILVLLDLLEAFNIIDLNVFQDHLRKTRGQCSVALLLFPEWLVGFRAFGRVLLIMIVVAQTVLGVSPYT